MTFQTQLGLTFFIGTLFLPQAMLLAAGEKVRVMTFNIRYANPNDPVVWDERRLMQVDLIKQYSPDVIGIQEGLKEQVDYLMDRLPEYVVVGEGRKGGDDDEHMAIFYKSKRFRLRELDSFWLSETPEIAGSGPDVNPRMVTWARFAFITRPPTGRTRQHPSDYRGAWNTQEFYFFNTHFFTGRHTLAKNNSAQLVMDRTRELRDFGHWSKHRPVFLVGDFNSRPGSKVHKILVGESDSDSDEGSLFRDSTDREGRRIDWILYRGRVKAVNYEEIDYNVEGKYPSDHLPIIADFEFEERTTRRQSLLGKTTPTSLTHGPFLGHTTDTTAKIWARCSSAGSYQLVAHTSDGTRHIAEATVTMNSDHCVVWTLNDLHPATEYSYAIRCRGEVVADDDGQRFKTLTEIGSADIASLAFGSCAREDPGSAGVWKQIKKDAPETLVLLGDTPYIDSTDLQHQRKRYQEFAAVPALGSLLQGCSLYGIWDDHDFGRNDTNGLLPGKERSRQVFLEYHANPSYGDGRVGVYTKFRRGPVEVFLLDARYFAGVEPSPVDKQKPTLLGTAQWNWLCTELKASSAPFKILAAGMIWNGAVRPNKPDHWETYSHERDALFKFIGRERISGVVLVGGDIHRTRVLKYDTTDTAGYSLTELITSPIHDGVMESADAPHPNLVFDAGMPHSFLLIDADSRESPATLTARFKNSSGKEFHTVRFSETDLRSAQ